MFYPYPQFVLPTFLVIFIFYQWNVRFARSVEDFQTGQFLGDFFPCFLCVRRPLTSPSWFGQDNQEKDQSEMVWLCCQSPLGIFVSAPTTCGSTLLLHAHPISCASGLESLNGHCETSSQHCVQTPKFNQSIFCNEGCGTSVTFNEHFLKDNWLPGDKSDL